MTGRIEFIVRDRYGKMDFDRVNELLQTSKWCPAAGRLKF
jgi:hypothetical protein